MCICCRIKESCPDPSAAYLSGISVGFLHMAEDYPVRLCDGCRSHLTTMMALMRQNHLDAVAKQPIVNTNCPTGVDN